MWSRKLDCRNVGFCDVRNKQIGKREERAHMNLRGLVIRPTSTPKPLLSYIVVLIF